MSLAKLSVSHSRWFLSSYLFFTMCFLVLGQTNAEKTLKFVLLVFRHGDRSPTATYPEDKYQEDSWPDGFGQLTKLGIEQHYELGQYLRKRYSGFLNETYSRHELHVRSTDMDRTLMSVQSNLAGLYPPVGRQIWNENIRWQPIPVHTVPLSEDNLLLMPLNNCPRYDKLQIETYASKEYHDLVDPYKDFIYSLQNDTGYSSEELNNIFTSLIIHNALFCEQIHNYTLPDWVTKDTMDKLSELSDIAMSTFFGVYKQYEKSRLQGGVLVSSILQNITHAATTPSTNLKLITYSAHDSTIVALQTALNVYNGKSPPYAACHIFELYKADDGEYTVEMYYRNDSSVDPYLVTLPGCSSSCPLAMFTELTSSIIVEDWEKECGAKVEGDKCLGILIGLNVAVGILSIAVLGLLILYCCCKKKPTSYKAV